MEAANRRFELVKSGRKKEGGGKYRHLGRTAHGNIKKEIAKQHSKKIGETIVPDDVLLEIAELAACADKSERQMRDIIHQRTMQNSRDGQAAFNIETFDTSSDTISYDTPFESWDNRYRRWSLPNSIQAGVQDYRTGLNEAHSNPVKPNQKKRGPKCNSDE